MNRSLRALTTTVGLCCDIELIAEQLEAMFSTLPEATDEPLLRYVIARDGDDFYLQRDDVIVYRDRNPLAMPPALELDLYRQVPRMTPAAWVLHAAGVASGTDAFVLVGASGAGKTTTSRQLIEGGWSYLSEEICAIHDDGRVVGLRRPLHLAPTATLADAAETTSNVHPSLWCPPDEQLLGEANLAAIVTLEFRPGLPWKLRQLSPAAGLARLWPQTFDTRPGPMRTATGLVARFPCYALRMGAPDHPELALSELRNLVR